MTPSNIEKISFIVVTFLVSCFFVYILIPYATAIISSIVLAVIASPLYKKYAKYFGEGHGATALTFMSVFFMIIIPVSLLIFWLTKTSTELYRSIQNDNFVFLEEMIIPIENLLSNHLPNVEWSVVGIFSELVMWLSNHLGEIFSATIHVMISLVVGSILFYFLIKDGRKIIQATIQYSPIADKAMKHIITQMQSMIDSVVKVNIITSIFQAVMSGIGFWIFGVPNPVLWATLTGFLSLLPALGVTSVMLVASVYLFYTSSIFSAIGLLAWAAVLVGFAEDMLRPYLVGKYNDTHPALVLIAVISGITTFGIVGIVLGPIILVLFLTMISTYKKEIGSK